MKEPITVLIPAFNEEHGIGNVLDAFLGLIREEVISGEIIVINDGSADGTAGVVTSYETVRLVEHEMNRGYGASLKTGIRHARHNLILIADADGTYPIESIPQLLEHIDQFDMVVGARIGQHVKIPLTRRPAKWLLGKLARYLAQRDIPDLNSGLRIFRKELAERFFPLFPDGFSFTITITMAALTNDYRVKFVPVNYYKRTGKSSIRPSRDFFGFLSLIVRMTVYFNPLRVFLPASFFLLLIGVIKAGIDVYLHDAFGVGTGLAILTAFLILCLGLLADLIIRRTHL